MTSVPASPVSAPGALGTLSWPELVRSAVLTHALPDVERALVRRFLADAGMTSVTSSLLVEHSRTSPEVQAVEDTFRAAVPLDLDELVKAFEVLLPIEVAQASGAVFTPSLITSFMAEEVLTPERINRGGFVVDPSCGCGALLVAALRRIHEVTGALPSSIVPRLVGVDISAESLMRARVLLALTALALGEDTDLEYALLETDSLTLDWKEAFPQVASFDAVLGNPPYVRYQNLPEAQRTALSERWVTLRAGSPNLYFAFFELARDLVDPDGVVAYITPNNFFATGAAKALREWLPEGGNLSRIVDFGHTRVFDALTYTAITFLNEKTGSDADSGNVRYRDVSSLALLRSDEEYAGVSRSDLTGAPWQLVGLTDQEAIKRILAQPRTLLDVAEITYGVKTCRDRAYLVKGAPDAAGFLTKEYLGQTWRIELSATVPHLVVPDAAREEDVKSSLQRIIYPYRRSGERAAIIPEDEFRRLYPETYKYLLAVRPELDNRDKGKKSYATWYAYARTQALLARPDKLLTPEYAARPRFMRDTRPDALFSNGCALTPRQGENQEALISMELLQVMVSSGVFHYFVEKTSTSIDGGFRSYQKSRIAPFGVVAFTPEEEKEFLTLSPRKQDLLLAAKYGVTLPATYLRP